MCGPATSNLKGKEKKKHEEEKVQALGGKAVGNRKVPYKVLIGMKTKGAARKQRREDLVRAYSHLVKFYAVVQTADEFLVFAGCADEGVRRANGEAEIKRQDKSPAEGKENRFWFAGYQGTLQGWCAGCSWSVVQLLTQQVFALFGSVSSRA